MNYIEIDYKLINISNIVYIEKYKISDYIINVMLNTHNCDDEIILSFENEEERDIEYNRIKSILIGDNNEQGN